MNWQLEFDCLSAGEGRVILAQIKGPSTTVMPIPLVVAILFVSTFVRSTLGFGDALIAMPLLAMVIGIKAATPIVAFTASTIAGTILLANWRSVDFKAAWRLIVASLLGIPFGLVLLQLAPESLVKGILGLVLILFGLYSLVRPRLPTVQREGWAYLSGFVAGILGGAYNTNGPLVVIYGTLARWSPERFRATLQCYFFPTGLLILTGHGLAGLWTPAVLKLYGYALPLIMVAIFLGGKLNDWIPPGHFDRLVYAFLVVIGVFLMV